MQELDLFLEACSGGEGLADDVFKLLSQLEGCVGGSGGDIHEMDVLGGGESHHHDQLLRKGSVDGIGDDEGGHGVWDFGAVPGDNEWPVLLGCWDWA